ncbi:Photosystem II reaction center protein K [Nymphaea thermarum]|nr:Photosystem II reaction center protein K [Nymphaea thermarum]
MELPSQQNSNGHEKCFTLQPDTSNRAQGYVNDNSNVFFFSFSDRNMVSKPYPASTTKEVLRRLPCLATVSSGDSLLQQLHPLETSFLFSSPIPIPSYPPTRRRCWDKHPHLCSASPLGCGGGRTTARKGSSSSHATSAQATTSMVESPTCSPRPPSYSLNLSKDEYDLVLAQRSSSTSTNTTAMESAFTVGAPTNDPGWYWYLLQSNSALQPSGFFFTKLHKAHASLNPIVDVMPVWQSENHKHQEVPELGMSGRHERDPRRKKTCYNREKKKFLASLPESLGNIVLDELSHENILVENLNLVDLQQIVRQELKKLCYRLKANTYYPKLEGTSADKLMEQKNIIFQGDSNQGSEGLEPGDRSDLTNFSKKEAPMTKRKMTDVLLAERKGTMQTNAQIELPDKSK